MNAQKKAFLSRQEACTQLGVSLSTLIRRLDEGTIPHVRLGARILIPSDFLEKLAETANTREGA